MRLSLFILSVCVLSGSVWAQPTALEWREEAFDERYPQMKSWAQAGIETSKLPDTPKTTVRLKPGEDLHTAARQPHTQIQLSAGDYQLTETLKPASGVVIRGVGIGRTRLVIFLREDEASQQQPDETLTGILFESTNGAGLENLTVMMDDSLIPPTDPRDGPYAYDNNQDGQVDLHVTLVGFRGSRNSWLVDCELLNAGTHPLVIRDSSHLTIESTEILASYNKSKGLGTLTIAGSDYCLLHNLRVHDINYVTIKEGTNGRSSHHNVLTQARLNIDVRLQGKAIDHNLIQDCLIDVAAWHHAPPIAHISEPSELATANYVFLCTITRNFATGGRHFSIAGNPNAVYQILKSATHETIVKEVGPAPHLSTLWPMRAK